ncbi:DNA ligase D [Brevundimonas naejangsanensis]|uniref:DNA ligase D n=1 Tax=Brevundimonas naejangsanensis TaxID=588932 RepID=UPI00106C251B|nr:DNA ligase D [Brevundimonas naejangsanensis]QBQ48629.1 DNA ligase D [Brevundimonas naejangsanensis]
MRGELKTYQAKRRFEQTPEPKGAQRAGEKDARRFVIQRHAATRLHYDFRIEADGVLKSWAVTKAPSRDPAIKRLAVEVEDHPLDYGDFEGTIPAGNYGAGTVQLWDVGSWEPQEANLEAAWARGQIKMILHGERLKGKWALIRLKSDRGKPSKRNNWLLLKEKDEHAVAGEGDALAQIDASVTTGRSLAQIAEGDAQWTSSKPTRRKAPPKPAPSEATSKAKRPPAFVPIQLCKAVDHPPSATGWAHEIKFDGYRLQIGIGGGQAVLRTRKGLDWSDRFPELATDAAGWPDAVIDGELCALDDDHMPDFSALQAAISEGETDRLVYFAFDLLFEGAEDLRKLPLSHRKARLQAYIDRLGAKGAARLRYVEHFASTGQAVLESACRMHLEGVISKKLDAPYHAGRSSSWLKSKCRGRDEVVIGGWSSEGGSRFRSLLVGVREKGGMKYLGRVGTGFGETATRLLMPALKAEAADKSPFVGPGAPKGGKDIHWVKPRLVAEIEHGGYTESGALRHAAFKGLRDDKTAEDVTDAPQAPAAPQAPRKNGKVSVAGVAISSPDKVLWPGAGGRPPITKADLARYYEAAAERLLAHVADRPVSIIRAPDGIEGETFFQRHAMAGSNPRLKLIDVKARTPYVAVVDVGGLAAVAQSGGLELHPWGCKPGDPETPDQITFDLDPDEGLDFDDVIAAALVVRAKLEALGLNPFVKTTGGKGLHLVVPIRADGRSRVTWDQNKAFAKAVSEAIKADAPDRFTTTLAKKARGGKIFIDYLRNGRMATAVAPWSPRARPGAGIAFPLSWDQVKPGLNPADYNLWVWPELLQRPDAWSGFRDSAVSLRPALRKMGVE